MSVPMGGGSMLHASVTSLLFSLQEKACVSKKIKHKETLASKSNCKSKKAFTM